jgi:hypothetical protein
VEPRIFRKERPATDEASERSVNRGRRPTVVIADSGTGAEVLVFPPGEAISVGTEFQHRGTTWVITGRRRDSRVLVAESAAH